MDYFTLAGKKIFVEINNNTIIFKKYINDILIQLNNEEILSKLKKENGYFYCTETLINIMKSNSSLNSNFDYFYNFLEFIERVIPENYRNNFYNNLKTLQIELNLEETFDVSDNKSFYTVCGGYNTIDNKITMSRESIRDTREISKLSQDPKSFFWKHYNKDLLHEFFHMSSSFYDKKSRISLSGFNKYPSSNISDSNRGLTEGMTEVLACWGIPDTIEIACGYYIEELFVNQLIQIVGIETMLISYFGNLGNKLLCEKLCDLDKDMNNALSVFFLIELNFNLRTSNENQTILGSVQKKLIEYFSIKIINDINIGKTDEEIRNSMNVFKKLLVTREILLTMKKNPDNYPNLDESLNEFKKLEETIEQIFQSRKK